nr:hypothetical protein [Tanacetum cinerariifolium]
MHVYVELVEKGEEHDSDNDSDSDSESGNEIVDEEHVVDEVEVNVNKFKFQIDKEDKSSGNDAIVPNTNVIEDYLEVLDFDSLESDLKDVPENARSLGFRKLNKKHSSSKFFIGKEFVNRELAKDLIRDHVVESMRNLHFLRNAKRRIRVVCDGVVPRKNVIIDKVQGPVVEISGKGKLDKAFRAKAKAQVHLRGDVKGQYALLRDYVYDGAFMRGQYPGQMLTAVGVDANNGIYPVAYGIVESENQYSWTWFLKCLRDDFDLYSNSNFTFITKRKKGLLPELAKLFPSAEHRTTVGIESHLNAVGVVATQVDVNTAQLN